MAGIESGTSAFGRQGRIIEWRNFLENNSPEQIKLRTYCDVLRSTGFIHKSVEMVMYIYAAGLIYSACLRIRNSFRKTAIVFIQ